MIMQKMTKNHARQSKLFAQRSLETNDKLSITNQDGLSRQFHDFKSYEFELDMNSLVSCVVIFVCIHYVNSFFLCCSSCNKAH